MTIQESIDELIKNHAYTKHELIPKITKINLKDRKQIYLTLKCNRCKAFCLFCIEKDENHKISKFLDSVFTKIDEICGRFDILK